MTTIWYEIWKYDISTLYSYLPWKNYNNIWNMKIWHLNMKIWHLNSLLVPAMKKRQQYDMKYEISTLYSYLPWKNDNNMIWNMKIWHLNSVLVSAMKKWQQSKLNIEQCYDNGCIIINSWVITRNLFNEWNLMNGKINIFRSHDTDLYIPDSIFCEC